MAFSPLGILSSSNNPTLGVYIWSACFEELGITKIARFIETKNIERIDLSYKPYSEREDVRDWTRKLIGQGKVVEIVLSEPSYIFPEKWFEVKSKLLSIFKSGYNVHFDIEPHILPDFKRNKDQYLKLFVALLTKAHLIAMQYNKKTSVAISISHYKSVIDNIINNSDLVVFMAYGFKNTKKICRIVNPYEQEKIALALRGKDFTREKELFQYINNIAKLSGIRIFIIHNLRQWKELK